MAHSLHGMPKGNPGRFEFLMIGIAAVQIAICVGILLDVWRQGAGFNWSVHWIELGSAVLLFCCTLAAAYAWRKERRMLDETRRTLEMYSSGLTAIVGASFTTWHLTTAESDVALLALKGFENQEIADIRHAAAGTVRAQLARVYAKAGVDSRAGLQGLFLEDLMSGLPADSLEMARALGGSAMPDGLEGGRQMHG